MVECEQEPEEGALPSDGSVRPGERFRDLPRQARDVFRGSYQAIDLQERFLSFSADCREAKGAFGAVLDAGSVAQQECFDIHTQALGLIDEIYQWAGGYVHDLVYGNGPPGDVLDRELQVFANRYDSLVRRRDFVLATARTTLSQAEAVGTGGESDAATDTPTQVGYYSALELAKKHHLLYEPVRKRLERWRRSKIPGTDFIDNRERARNKAKYVYKEAVVLPLIQDLKTQVR
jgi:hypothetical protein